MPLHLDTAIFNPSLYKTIRAIWFADVPLNSSIAPQAATKRWFGMGSADEKAEFDGVCVQNCRSALESISPSKYPVPPARTRQEEQQQSSELAKLFLDQIEKTQDPDKPSSTALSLFLLLDQMPRNIFRDDQKLIYSHYDRLSRALAYSMLSKPNARWDLSDEYRLATQYRQWFYLPLMHSEHLEDHTTIIDLMESQGKELADAGDQEAVQGLEQNKNFEQKHYEIVKRFGRYPYRNDVLGRTWTEEERQWLKDGGDTFSS